MAEPWVKAQVTFTMTLMGDGSVLCNETFIYREAEDKEATDTWEYHPIEGTVEPQELAYALWAEMEGHI